MVSISQVIAWVWGCGIGKWPAISRATMRACEPMVRAQGSWSSIRNSASGKQGSNPITVTDDIQHDDNGRAVSCRGASCLWLLESVCYYDTQVMGFAKDFCDSPQTSTLLRRRQDEPVIRRKLFPICQISLLTIALKDAVAALNTLQTNSAVIDSTRKAGKSLNTQAIPEMIEWCRRAGYEVCANPTNYRRISLPMAEPTDSQPTSID